MEGWRSDVRQQLLGWSRRIFGDEEYFPGCSLTVCEADGVGCDGLHDRMTADDMRIIKLDGDSGRGGLRVLFLAHV